MKIILTVLLFGAWGAMVYFMIRRTVWMNKTMDEQKNVLRQMVDEMEETK